MRALIPLVSVILLALTAAPGFADECGQPLTDGDGPRAVDALHILRASIGSRQCTLGACDLNSDCEVSVGDALRTLVASVGGDADRDCDANCPTEIVCEDAGAPTCNGLCPAGYACTVDGVGEVDPDERATVCHVPPGNASKAHTIVVDLSSTSAHLRHGDYLGPCDDDASADMMYYRDKDHDSDSDSHSDPNHDSDKDSDSDHDLGCICEPRIVSTTTLPDATTTTTTVDVPDATTTSTSTTSTTFAPPVGDRDNDGLADEADPCADDARNGCFGEAAVDRTTEMPIRVNANASGADECSGDRTDCSGDKWFADFGFNDGGGGHSDCGLNGGEPNCVIAGLVGIFGCQDDATEDLLQCEHFDRPTEPEMYYTFDLADGTYLVNLYFANTYDATAGIGKRTFDIAIEGSIVYPAFDQVQAAGGSGRAVVRAAVSPVSDGNGLTIEFGHITENPSVKAIEVLTAAP